MEIFMEFAKKEGQKTVKEFIAGWKKYINSKVERI